MNDNDADCLTTSCYYGEDSVIEASVPPLPAASTGTGACGTAVQAVPYDQLPPPYSMVSPNYQQAPPAGVYEDLATVLPAGRDVGGTTLTINHVGAKNTESEIVDAVAAGRLPGTPVDTSLIVNQEEAAAGSNTSRRMKAVAFTTGSTTVALGCCTVVGGVCCILFFILRIILSANLTRAH